MDKVKVSADERLMAGFPAMWSAKVRVHAGGDRERENPVERARRSGVAV